MQSRLGIQVPCRQGHKVTCKCGGVCHGKARGMSKADFRGKAEENPLWYLDEPQAAEHQHDSEPTVKP